MRRRRAFLQRMGAAGVHVAAGWACGAGPAGKSRSVKLFLCGDVMTGRGIDQILGQPSEPGIYEDYVKSARDYVRFAEQRNGPIPRRAEPSYIWGDALAELERAQPDLRIINLETSITTSTAAEAKGINYRMHPANVTCLTAAGIDCCVLANNHVLDWGCAGLNETLKVLHAATIQTAGAGANLAEARRQASMDVRAGGRVLVYAVGGPDCGIPPAWAAGEDTPGVDYIGGYTTASATSITERILQEKRPGDLAIVSIHWGSNWGYRIPGAHQAFARLLIDGGGADLVYGHSSHHAKGMELYGEKLIFYGCGDFLNDYEGIEGYEQFRGDLALMYFPELAAPSGKLLGLRMVAMQVRQFRLRRAAQRDSEWLRDMFNREGRQLGTRFTLESDGGLRLG